MSRAIQLDWIFLERVTCYTGDAFAGVDKMIRENFLPRLFFRKTTYFSPILVWENNLVWKLDMMVRVQGTPMWEDEPVWWICTGLGNMERLGSIHNSKKQILWLEQSLTEAWKNHLIIRSHCSLP